METANIIISQAQRVKRRCENGLSIALMDNNVVAPSAGKSAGPCVKKTIGTSAAASRLHWVRNLTTAFQRAVEPAEVVDFSHHLEGGAVAILHLRSTRIVTNGAGCAGSCGRDAADLDAP